MKCGACNGRRKETEVGEARGTDTHGWEGFFSCLGAIPCGAQSLLLPLNSGIIPGGLRGDVKIQPKQAKCKARVLPTGPQEGVLSPGQAFAGVTHSSLPPTHSIRAEKALGQLNCLPQGS